MEFLRNSRVSKGMAGALASLALAVSGFIVADKFNRLPIRDGMYNWLGFDFPDYVGENSKLVAPEMIWVANADIPVFGSPEDAASEDSQKTTIPAGELVLMGCVAIDGKNRFKTAINIVGAHEGYIKAYEPQGEEAFVPVFEGLGIDALRRQLPPCD